jgi:hypothetical protein
LIPNMTLFEKKNFLLYLADFLPFGNTKAHFSAWKVDLKFLKNHIWCSFDFLITILPRFFGYRKKVKYWRWLMLAYTIKLYHILKKSALLSILFCINFFGSVLLFFCVKIVEAYVTVYSDFVDSPKFGRIRTFIIDYLFKKRSKSVWTCAVVLVPKIPVGWGRGGGWWRQISVKTHPHFSRLTVRQTAVKGGRWKIL